MSRVTANKVFFKDGLTMHHGIFCLVNSVHPNQLASEKPTDQVPHCFPFC